MERQTILGLSPRLSASVVDLWVIVISAMIFSLPSLAFDAISGVHNSIIFQICAALTWSLALNKDIVGGRSLGKHHYRFRVISNSGQIATPFQCLLRNFTILVWPVELIFLSINPMRRLGDLLAGTHVEADLTPNRPHGRLASTSILFVIVTWFFMFIAIWVLTSYF